MNDKLSAIRNTREYDMPWIQLRLNADEETAEKYSDWLRACGAQAVTFIDAKGTFGSNNLTVGRNSSNINGAASDLTVSTNGAAFTLVYLNATRGWSYKDKI